MLAVGETSKRSGAAVTEGVESVGPSAGPAWAGQMLDSPPFHLTHLEHLQLDCDSAETSILSSAAQEDAS